MTTFFYILLAIGFVLLNAFFVAAEFSIVSIRHTRVQSLQRTRGLRGRTLAKIHHQLDSYLSTCQLGITLASLGLGWIGEPAFAQILMPLFNLLGVKSSQTIAFFSFFSAFFIITYLHIVIGELMPKSIAIRQTEMLSLWTAIPLYVFYWMMYPVIWILNLSANFFLKIFGLDKVHTENLSYSTEEIKHILKASHRYGEFDKSELELLTKSLMFTDLEISDVMRPSSEMVSLDLNLSIEENIKKICNNQYTRYPVYKVNPNNIVGVLHIKDFFPAMLHIHKVKSLASFIRPILKVKVDDNLLDIFHQFRKGKPQFAIVYSENTPIGFVTLDNLLQAIIGEIKDEFHITKEDWIMLDDASFIIKGNAPVYTLEKLLGVHISDKAKTISGLVFDKLQGFPTEGQKIDFNDFTLVVKKIRGPRILQVRVYPKQNEPDEGPFA
ncbi:MAG: HlyC/CorC family transporter [Gammaproteobacteria bacterium]|jgi:CBS domain containing-hemolysin-like protein|nr:HlyC/CorC family transporter [Gammaproteobacteria bacterium]